jgi:pimeloyl-ACP methyl ester carboxylesterase
LHQPARPIEADAFYTSLRDRTADGVSTIALDGGNLPVSVQLRDSSAVVFSFSGAVERAKHPLPRFSSATLHNYVPATIIGLSDPSLAQSEDIKLAWYAGHEGFELQQILPDVLQRIVDSLGASRVAFVGSSGGGYAALYYSWKISDSVAIVSNPQTSLARYIQGHRKKYRAVCWPSLDANDPLDGVIDADLGPLYASRCDNTVVYLQVASDFFHVRQHFAPFVSAVSRDFFARLIIRMESWGLRGHHPVPASIWIPWMNAALSAPDTTAESIEATWNEQNQFRLPRLQPIELGASANGQAVNGEDLRKLAAPVPPRGDEQFAAELARAATAALLGAQSSERSPV